MTFLFLGIILKRTSTEAYVYMRRHQGAKVKYFDISNVIYHKFLHGAVAYALSGENVNVMLELLLTINDSYSETIENELMHTSDQCRRLRTTY